MISGVCKMSAVFEQFWDGFGKGLGGFLGVFFLGPCGGFEGFEKSSEKNANKETHEKSARKARERVGTGSRRCKRVDMDFRGPPGEEFKEG